MSKSSHFPRRALVTVAVLLVGFGALASRMGFLTIVRGQDYALAADANLQRQLRLEAPRGNILDRAGRPVARNRRAYSVTYSRYGRSNEEVHETLRLLGELLERDVLAQKEEILATRPSWTRHSIARRLSQQEVVPILERPDDFQGVRVEDDYRREYPYGPSLALVVGYLGKIQPAEVDTYTRPRYLPDDTIGRAGIEKAYEADLVDRPGTKRLVRNARGSLLEEPHIVQPAVPGNDLILSIDAELQELAFDLLGEETGSAVMMDVRSGDLLILASTPSFDPARPWETQLEGRPVSFLHRAYRGGYPPGSTFKIVTASAAMKHDWTPSNEVRCTGHYEVPGWSHRFNCHVRWGHGAVDLVEALKVSCNVYFYDAAHHLGSAPIESEAMAFGFSRRTGVDLPGEKSGSLASNASGGEVLNMAIGQGAFVATPLQVAVAYAGIANRDGSLPRPRVVREVRPANAKRSRLLPVERGGRVRIDSTVREKIVEGLFRAVNDEKGTAHKADFPVSWEVCGKTGTAENPHGDNDSWFACFFPRTSPTHVVVVHVEQVGDLHGGDVSAPIARALIAAFRDELGQPFPESELAAAP